MSDRIGRWVPRLAICTLVLAALAASPLRAAEILFVVDDDLDPIGVADKGSVDVGSDTNEGPNTHPSLGLKQRMEALGHTVTLLDERVDVLGTQAAMAGKQLIVISSSVGSGNITFAKFGATPLPIINMEPASYDNLEMSSVDSVVDNAVTSINITPAGAGSPLAGGFPAGIRDVGDRVNLLPAGTAAPGAIIIAEGGTDNRVAIFDIPQGAQLDDGTAAAGRRIAFFWNANGIAYNGDGERLFDRAVQNAIPEPAGACLLAAMGLFATGRRRRRATCV